MNKDKYVEIKVYVTTNYDQFILLPENRPVKGNIVADSIRKENLLFDNPILVTQNLEVLDGQHRLAFARDQQIPIYYKIAQITKRQHIALLQKANPWRLSNHQNFYKNNKDYAFVQEIVEKYKLSIYLVIGCCDQKHGASQRFKSGEFCIECDKDLLASKFDEFNQILEICNLLLKTCDENKLIINNKFSRALWSFIQRKDYNHERFFHSVNMNPEDMINILKVYSEKLVYESLKILFNKSLKNHKRIA